MRRKKIFPLALTICLSLLLTQVAYAGTLFTGQNYTYNTGVSGVNYYCHFSASSNTNEAPNRIVGNGYGMTDVPIDFIQNTIRIYINDMTVIKSQTQTFYDSNFNSLSVSYSGWPTGASYCSSSMAVYFHDEYYGSYLAVDASGGLYK